MRPVRVSLLALVTGLAAVGSLADDAAIDPGALDNLEKAYPAAPEGMERKVILLPHKERGIDDDFRVELVVGRTVPTDGVNIHRFGGELDEVDIPGWGFSYYKVDGDLAQPASTRIAGTGETKPRFVPGPTRLVPYNSRLPLVVMVPQGCELRWRVWKAADVWETADDR